MVAGLLAIFLHYQSLPPRREDLIWSPSVHLTLVCVWIGLFLGGGILAIWSLLADWLSAFLRAKLPDR